MEGNLLASIFYASEQVAEWKRSEKLPDADKLLLSSDSQREPTEIPDASNSSAVDTAPTTPSGQRISSGASKPSSAAKVDHYVDDSFTVAVGAIVKRTDENSILRNSHLEYGITITRLADGASHTIFRRFRDIKTFYYDLLVQYEEIDFSKDIKFPLGDSWLSSSSTDPHSEKVIKRKLDLQLFFSDLFQSFPKLFETSIVRAFLEIDHFPPKAHSTFSIHYGASSHFASDGASDSASAQPMLPSIESIMSFNPADAPEYNVKKGRMEKKEVKDWQNYQGDEDKVSLVEFMTHAEYMKEVATRQREHDNIEQAKQRVQIAGQQAQ
eukprot:gene28714-34665_t